MDNITLSFTIGILSSLVATLVLMSLAELIRKIVLPWYEDKIYQGIRIDGDWECIKAGGHDCKTKDKSMTISLQQKGEKITGSYIHKSNDDEIDEYVLEGKIRNMYFLATAVPKSKRLVDGICILLHVNNNKSNLIMTGSILAQGEPGNVISYNDVEFIWHIS